MIKAIEAIAYGRVQGVMFRDFTQRKGNSLGLIGEVENLKNGSTRIYAEGEDEKLEMLISSLKKGSIFSRVDNLEYKFLEPKGDLSDFKIKYT